MTSGVSSRAIRSGFPTALCLCTVAAWLLASVSAHAKPEHGQEFKDWTAGCETPAESDAEQCYIFQNLILKDGGQRLLHIAVGYLASNGKPAAIITFPLGISLPPGVSIRIDDGEKLPFAVERCHANGCVGAVALDEAMIESMKKGSQAQIAFHDSNRREIGVPVSLQGFTAGFNSLR